MILIAISQRNDKNNYGNNADNLENNYINYFEKFGIKLIIIPNPGRSINSYFNLPIKGIILSGGNDINPKLYGKKLREDISVSNERDYREKSLVDISIRKKLPILGICRGMQFINVFFKGELINIKKELVDHIEHIHSNHKIDVTNDKAIETLGKKFEVNSFHNYGIYKDGMSHKLRSFAVASDGIIEGIYHPLLPIAGIQWHPERKSPDENVNRKIMTLFLNNKLFWKNDAIW